jgi:hypothetical protein
MEEEESQTMLICFPYFKHCTNIPKCNYFIKCEVLLMVVKMAVMFWVVTPRDL